MKRGYATSEEWAARVEAWQQSGLSKTEWCKENDIGYKRFLYWEKLYRQPKEQQAENLQNQPTGFVQLEREKHETLLLRIDRGSVCIEVSVGYNADLLASVVRTVRQVC